MGAQGRRRLSGTGRGAPVSPMEELWKEDEARIAAAAARSHGSDDPAVFRIPDTGIHVDRQEIWEMLFRRLRNHKPSERPILTRRYFYASRRRVALEIHQRGKKLEYIESYSEHNAQPSMSGFEPDLATYIISNALGRGNELSDPDINGAVSACRGPYRSRSCGACEHRSRPSEGSSARRNRWHSVQL